MDIKTKAEELAVELICTDPKTGLPYQTDVKDIEKFGQDCQAYGFGRGFEAGRKAAFEEMARFFETYGHWCDMTPFFRKEFNSRASSIKG